MNSIFKILLSLLILIGQFEFSYAQTASILPPAKTTFVDKNGKPLTSGTVDFYIPGTTTRKMTWQDAGQTIPNANPLTLDGSGRATILGDGSYRQVLKDRNGNVVWDGYTASTGSGGGGTTPTVGDGDAVGTIKPWAGFIAPYGYVFAYGQELVRASYPEAFAAMTSNQNVTCTLGSPTLTGVSSTSQLPIGAPIESSCLNAGATILSKTINSVTATSNAIISTTSTARFFPFGNGDGSLTFNTPDLRGQVLAGANNMGGVAASTLTSTYFGTDPNALSAKGGTQSKALLTANIPAITSTGTNNISVVTTNSGIPSQMQAVGTVQASTGSDNGVRYPGSLTIGQLVSSGSNSISVTTTGTSGTAFSIVQPTTTFNYIIKIIPDSNPNSFFGVASIGGMYGVLECGVGITCAGNTISAINSTLTPPTPIILGGIFQSNAPANQFAIGVDLAGNILYSGGSTTVNGQVCTIGSSCTITASAGTITVGTTTIAGGSSNSLLYNNSGTLGNVVTANNSVLVTNGSGVPSIASTLPSGLIIPSPTVNSAALSGTFTGIPTFSGANFITNSNLAQAGAATLKGNPTVSTANVQDFTIQGLTNLPSPDPTLDFVPIYDAASGTIKKATPQAIAAASTAGVASIGGLTGVVGVNNGISVNSTNIGIDQAWRGYVTSAQYGVTCDGVTDDSAAMQTFLTALGTTPYPMGIINGTSSPGHTCYMGTTTLSVPGYSVVMGGTAQTTLKWSAAKTGNLIQPVGTNSYQVTFENLIIDGTTKGSQTAIRITGTSLWNLRNMQINNVDTCVLFDAAGIASNYQWTEHVTCSDANFGYYFNGISNSNTLIGARCNFVTTCITDFGNNNKSIGVAMENVTTAIRLEASSASYSSIGDRCENATTCFLTVSGATKAAYINPIFTGTITTRVNDVANALINSLFEYRTTVAINSAISANSTLDTLVNTGIMANCTASAEVVASLNIGTAPNGVIATGGYRVGVGPYVRMANVTTGSITPNTDVTLTCRQRQ